VAKTTGTALTQLAMMALNVAAGVVLARWLGPEDRGRYALLILIPQMLFVVANLGVGAASTYFAGSRNRPPAEILGLALLLAATLGTGSALLFLAGLPLYGSFWSGAPLVFVVGMAGLTPLLFARNFLARFLAGRQRIGRMNLVNIWQALVLLLAAALLVIVLRRGLGGAIGAFAASIIAALAIALAWALRESRGRVLLRSESLRPMLTYGLQAHLLVVANFLNYRFDLFLVKHFLDDTAVGHYSIAVGLAERLWILPNALATVLFPTVAALESQDAHRLAARSARTSFAIMLAASVALALLGRPAILLLYGEEYLPSLSALFALLPGIALFPLFKILAVHAAGRGRPLWGALPSFLVLVLNIGANLVLIPRWGIVGAALASSLSYGVAGVACVLFFARHAGIPLREALVPRGADWTALRRVFRRR
jgi:O-antigen/teichoic acid export membrane protein